MPRKVAVIMGTRPEAIKLAPVVKALERSTSFEPVVISSGQHRDILDQVLNYFALKPHFDLGLIRPNQTPGGFVGRCVEALTEVLGKVAPELVLVQGDTGTTLSGALAAFYLKIPVGHIEAGLRSFDRFSPFPEEINRRIATTLCDLHFPPTEKAKANLLEENVSATTIEVVGNTGIDALLSLSTIEPQLPRTIEDAIRGKKLLLLTMHRRENFGEPVRQLLQTIRSFLEKRADCFLIYPVHPNPNVQSVAHAALGNLQNVLLLPPVTYGEMVALLKKSWLVLTDSGGLQEEAPTLAKPVLVLRNTTERPEAVEAGGAVLCGADVKKLEKYLAELTRPGSQVYQSMAQQRFLYGDGKASERIVKFLETYYRQTSEPVAA